MKKIILVALLLTATFTNAQTCFTRNRVRDNNTEEIERNRLVVCHSENRNQLSFLDVDFDITEKRKDDNGNVWIMTTNPHNYYVLFGFDIENGYIYVYSQDLEIDLTLFN